jgi:Lar family restriction alleviation protein
MKEKVIIANVKRCPFCGRKAIIGTYEYDLGEVLLENGRIAKTYFVRCEKCQAEAFETETVEEAVKKWNQRVSESVSSESDVIQFVY